jgi:predicted transcriptional regulator
MPIDVEVNQLDLRYEKNRMRQPARERQLLSSILEVGITDPLWGVKPAEGQKVLLDGFKRLRCALKVGLRTVPFESLGNDEPQAIIGLLKACNRSAISLLEQAVFVEELNKTHGLSVAEIARRLQRSKAWVSVRLQTFSQMSESTRASILSGGFPLYSYIYTLLPFRRLNGSEAKAEVDEFVSITSGKHFTTRETERLAGAFFRGGPEMREQIRGGDLNWCLDEMRRREEASKSSELTENENRIVRDLEIILGVTGRLGSKLPKADVEKPAFKARVDLLTAQVLSKLLPFSNILKEFYDRCRKA